MRRAARRVPASYQNAQRLGIKLMSEQEFFAMLCVSLPSPDKRASHLSVSFAGKFGLLDSCDAFNQRYGAGRGGAGTLKLGL